MLDWFGEDNQEETYTDSAHPSAQKYSTGLVVKNEPTTVTGRMIKKVKVFSFFHIFLFSSSIINS